MTRRQRAQVVELLRCAADLFMTGRNKYQPTFECSGWERDDLYEWAWGAINGTCDASPSSFGFVLLEAAQRVEEGSWRPNTTGRAVPGWRK